MKLLRGYYYLIPDAQAFSNAFFGQGSGSIYLDSVQCSGSELDLFDCPGDTTPSCTHSDDAGVRCNPTRKQKSCRVGDQEAENSRPFM